jgi:hypothetical protein
MTLPVPAASHYTGAWNLPPRTNSDEMAVRVNRVTQRLGTAETVLAATGTVSGHIDASGYGSAPGECVEPLDTTSISWLRLRMFPLLKTEGLSVPHGAFTRR